MLAGDAVPATPSSAPVCYRAADSDDNRLRAFARSGQASNGVPLTPCPPPMLHQRVVRSLRRRPRATFASWAVGHPARQPGAHIGGRHRTSQVPGEPPCIGAPLSDPGGTPPPGLYGDAVLPSAVLGASAPASPVISGLHHAARMLAVYASPQQLPAAAQDSLPAGGQPLPGGTGYPLGPSRSFTTAFFG